MAIDFVESAVFLLICCPLNRDMATFIIRSIERNDVFDWSRWSAIILQSGPDYGADYCGIRFVELTAFISADKRKPKRIIYRDLSEGSIRLPCRYCSCPRKTIWEIFWNWNRSPPIMCKGVIKFSTCGPFEHYSALLILIDCSVHPYRRIRDIVDWSRECTEIGRFA